MDVDLDVTGTSIYRFTLICVIEADRHCIWHIMIGHKIVFFL